MAQVAEGGAVWEGLYYNLTQGRVLAPIEQHIITCTVGHGGVGGNIGGTMGGRGSNGRTSTQSS